MTWLLHLILLFQPYSRYTCSQFVSFGHRACTAKEIYEGCHGTLVESKPKMGVIAAYGGRHVGFYITQGVVLDSTPEHGVMIHRIPARDPWYQNPRYLVRK